MSILESLREISIEKPSDVIIRQIRELITSGQLNPGDTLPSERKLSEKFGVGRSYVREAIKKLEFYGILRTSPQSGTTVAGMGMQALQGLITDVLKMNQGDFHSLAETRVILETNAAKLAASRRTEEDIERMEAALLNYEKSVAEGSSAVEEDLMFHLSISEAAKNGALKNLLMIIVPDILTFYNKEEVCGKGRARQALEEHKAILRYIKEGNAEAAETAMYEHLQDVLMHSMKQRTLV
ncbi:FadR/GntR family transcriptional regulator [Algivirga pacifica]|uniref:GntR family transcriptional regulator n=1 Tax=Algivirga pacifica TaxID=1162670 RepID=A0ABP9DN95_9BACT